MTTTEIMAATACFISFLAFIAFLRYMDYKRNVKNSEFVIEEKRIKAERLKALAHAYSKAVSDMDSNYLIGAIKVERAR